MNTLSIRILKHDGTFTLLSHKGKTQFTPATARRHLTDWQARYPSREAVLAPVREPAPVI